MAVKIFGDWRGGLVAALRRSGFSSQHPCGSSHPPITPVPGDPTSSSGLQVQYMYMMQRYTYVQAITHIKIKLKKSFFKIWRLGSLNSK